MLLRQWEWPRSVVLSTGEPGPGQEGRENIVLSEHATGGSSHSSWAHREGRHGGNESWGDSFGTGRPGISCAPGCG